MNFWVFSVGCLMKFMCKLQVSGAPESRLYSWSKRHAPFNTQCLLICRDDSSLQVGLFWSVIWSVRAGSPRVVPCCRYRLHLPKLSLAVGNLQQEPALSKKCFCSLLWDPRGYAWAIGAYTVCIYSLCQWAGILIQLTSQWYSLILRAYSCSKNVWVM